MKRLGMMLRVAPALLTILATGAQAAQFEVVGQGEAVLRAGPAGPPTLVPPDAGIYAKRRTATIKVNYKNFTPEAKQAFQRAVDIWERKITSSETIVVNATWKKLGPGVLGSAGPLFVACDGSPPCPKGIKTNVGYPVAIANRIVKDDVLPNDPDINANFSSAFKNWHFGAGDAPGGPNAKFDFTSVVLHELGHGLGFSGGAAANDSVASIRVILGVPTIYSTFTVDKANKKLTSFPDPSAKLRDVLTSGKVFFKVGKAKYKLFAPPAWQQGSSYSHLDEQTFKPGNKNSLMTPQIGPGETIRDPGPITLKIFKAIGWK